MWSGPSGLRVRFRRRVWRVAGPCWCCGPCRGRLAAGVARGGRDRLVVLPAGRTASGRSEVGLLLLSVEERELTVERFVAFDHPAIAYIPDWPHFVDDRRVWTRASTTIGRDDRYVGVECELVELRCSTTSEPTAPTNAAVVRDLSRG